jgi:hypothetical protein
MAFIEGSRGNVLFTGDFRLPMNCASRLAFFKEKNPSIGQSISIKPADLSASLNKIKSVDHLYIDMTFFKPEIKYIPTREESVRALLKFLNSYLDLDNGGRKSKDKPLYYEKLVYMKTSARIGYEYVFQEIFKHTGFKIHVNDLIFKIYDKLPVIQNCLTRDPYETPIHSCVYENRKKDLAKTDLMSSSLDGVKKPYTGGMNRCVCADPRKPLIPCMINDENKHELRKPLKVHAVKIILSAMWFTDTAGVDQIFVGYKPPANELETLAYKPYNSVYRLCFSFHSSFEEIVDFVNTLRPGKIHSIALPEATKDRGISSHFYRKGEFVGFSGVPHEDSSFSVIDKKKMGGQFSDTNVNSLASRSLVLRKRKSNVSNTADSSSDNLTGSEDTSGSLNFGSCDEDESDDRLSPKKKLRI